jgi:hypothetical protein
MPRNTPGAFRKRDKLKRIIDLWIRLSMEALDDSARAIAQKATKRWKREVRP